MNENVQKAGAAGRTLNRRSFVGGLGLTAMGLALAGCSSEDDGSSSNSSGNSAVVDGVNSELVPSTTPNFALVQGTWKEMGAQLAKEFPEEFKLAINIAVGNAMTQCEDYDALVKRYEPFQEIYDETFEDEKDGKLTDLITGLADGLELDYWQAATLLFPASPEGDLPDDKEGNGEKDCSAAIAWGEATASGETGCISVMDADIDIQELHYEPTVIFKPTNGYTFMSMNGLFGSVANAEGFAIQSPGGSSNLEATYGTFPHMWIAAYCKNVEEAVEFMGNPEDDSSSWVNLAGCYNMMMCDASGNALDYQVNSSEREIRRCGDVKHLSMAEGDEMPQETSTYLLTNNLFLTEGMLAHVLSDVHRDILEYWDDPEPRYWTVDKVLSDAVAAGGITLDTLSEAEGETRYYIPEGWDYDYFPDNLAGRWVPTSIYETLDEEGGMTRAEYYGKNYDPEVWGAPYTKEESRAVEAWAAGWHEPSWSATPEVSTMGYWAPTPVSSVDKNGSRDLFDSNTRTVYYMNGSSDRLLSNTVASTGTYAIVRFYNGEEETDDEMGEIVNSAVTDLKQQLWLAARDMEARGVNPDSEDDSKSMEYLDTAREALYQGINYQSEAFTKTELDERLERYTRALCALEKGICYAQLAQTEPGKIEKDLGDYMVDVKNLQSEQ